MKQRIILVLGIYALFSAGCITDGEVDLRGNETTSGEAQILNMTVSPSSISETETGQATFDIEISIANFGEEPDSVNVFIQDGDRIAQFHEEDLYINGNLILIDDVIA